MKKEYIYAIGGIVFGLATGYLLTTQFVTKGVNMADFQGGPNGQGGAFQGRPQGNRGTQAGGFGGIGGVVTSIDANTMNVKDRNGSSKIIILASSTQVFKNATSSMSVIASGTQVMINGKTNADGTIVAESINVRN